MKHILPGSTAILVALLLNALCSCRDSNEASPANHDPTPAGSLSARTTLESTLNTAIAVLKEERLSQFPALASLALAVKREGANESREDFNSLEPEDLLKVGKLLEAAKSVSPRLIENGRVAIYRLPGYGLPRDELKMVRLRNNWYFVVD